ncbi:Crp/Fnr family transcriptional regulator [Paramagnetospirillum caucaseum]|uniref:Crp/Fnr family transcriptional regulator n=1 Tax=Paramagnetospirillum caucaseum TaxID=1244869 RepID=UPI00034B93A2|nr:Crp/Fnr family transcriptional regulator [Paramagnetospirillum caucaseum]
MRLSDALSAGGRAPPPVFDHWPRRRPERQALERLGQVPPFTLLSPNQLADLVAGAEVLTFTETTRLFDVQASADALYVVLRGTVVLLGPDGVIVDGISAPGILGVADLFSRRHMFSAEAMAAPVIMKLPRRDVLIALERNGAMANAFLGLVAANTQTLANALMAQRCLTGVQRLAAFLLDQADQAGADQSFVLDIPKKAIAGQLGMTAAHFARSLTRLAEAGVERRNRNTIILNDISALRRLLEGELGVATQDGSTAQHKQLAAYRNFRNV